MVYGLEISRIGKPVYVNAATKVFKTWWKIIGLDPSDWHTSRVTNLCKSIIQSLIFRDFDWKHGC